MRRLGIFQTISSLVAMAIVANVATANIVLNPGFELGIAGDADDWEEISSPAGTTSRSDLMPNSETYSAYMTVDHVNNSPGAGAYFVQQTLPVGSIDNTLNYNLSFSAKVDSDNFAGINLFYQILWLDQDASDGGGVKGELLESVISAGIDSTYQSFGMSNIDAPEGSDSLLLRFQLSAGPVPDALNGFYVDDIDLFASPSDGLLADFDMDGDVDGNDFLKWQRGETSPPLDATALTNWQAEYGMNSPIAATFAIPEPSAICLLTLGLFGVLKRHW